MAFVDFAEVEELADIVQLAQMLNLDITRSGRQFRCSCPVHGGNDRAMAISPEVRSRRGSLGVFFCQKEQTGGDRIGLVAHCMEIGQQDAAFFIQQQFGNGNSTVGTGNSNSHSDRTSNSTVSKKRADPPAGTKREQPRPKDQPFDAAAFAAKLEFTDEVAELGFTEADAERFGVGFYRGKVYIPLRDEDGAIAGFLGHADGTLKLPGRWLPKAGEKVVPFPKKQSA